MRAIDALMPSRRFRHADAAASLLMLPPYADAAIMPLLTLRCLRPVMPATYADALCAIMMLL